MVKRKKKTSAKSIPKKLAGKISQGLATLALILNVIFPGIGSMVAGKIKTGALQLILMVIVLFIPLKVGFLIWIAAIIWGIVTGVLLIRDSQ